MADWSEIMRAVREQVTAQAIHAEQTQLEYGQFLAWAVIAKVGSATDGFSPVHRVGLPKGNAAYTTCGVPIAAPRLWFPLSPAILRTMPHCGFCETNDAAQPRDVAA